MLVLGVGRLGEDDSPSAQPQEVDKSLQLVVNDSISITHLQDLFFIRKQMFNIFLLVFLVLMRSKAVVDLGAFPLILLQKFFCI